MAYSFLLHTTSHLSPYNTETSIVPLCNQSHLTVAQQPSTIDGIVLSILWYIIRCVPLLQPVVFFLWLQPHGAGKYTFDIGCRQEGDYIFENKV